MKEIFLNELSLPVGSGLDAENDWILDQFVQAVAGLVKKNLSPPILRLNTPTMEIEFSEGVSLDGALLARRNRGGFRDEYMLIRRLTQKVPYNEGFDCNQLDRFHRCEAFVDGRKSIGLLWCALGDYIAVSFSSKAVWKSHLVELNFRELDVEGEIACGAVSVANVSLYRHVELLVADFRNSLISGLSINNFSAQHAEIFENLEFGLDVASQLKNIDAATFRLIIEKFISLDLSGAEWAEARSPKPRWRTHVSPESEKAKNHSRVIADRTFKDHLGQSRFFELHARYGSAGRIHLLLDSVNFKIVIGYIGQHLWLPD